VSCWKHASGMTVRNKIGAPHRIETENYYVIVGALRF